MERPGTVSPAALNSAVNIILNYFLYFLATVIVNY